MPLDNQILTNKPSLYSVLNTLKECINYNLDCVKVATVLEFNPELLTVKCRVNSKRLIQLKNDGNQVLKSYPDIYAKAHFFGWGDVGSIYPIEPGMEGLLLFNDRELETWFMTSEGGNLAYDRCHDLTDALFICGLHSQPKIPLAPYLEACLHIYYKNSDIQIRDKSIITNTTDNTLNAQTSDTINTTNYNLNSTTNTIKSTTTNITSIINQTGNVTILGTTNSTVLQDNTAATGVFTSADGKIITVVQGIVRKIEG